MCESVCVCVCWGGGEERENEKERECVLEKDRGSAIWATTRLLFLGWVVVEEDRGGVGMEVY